MLHVVKMIERRYPDRAAAITTRLLLASGGALAVGIGMLILA